MHNQVDKRQELLPRGALVEQTFQSPPVPTMAKNKEPNTLYISRQVYSFLPVEIQGLPL